MIMPVMSGSARRDEAQRERHDDDAREQALLGQQLLDVALEPALLGLLLREARRRPWSLDRDAGERLRELRERHVARTGRRIDDAHAVLDDAIEHDEVVELPVQDRAVLSSLICEMSTLMPRPVRPYFSAVSRIDFALTPSRPMPIASRTSASLVSRP